MWFVKWADELDLLSLRYYWTSAKYAGNVASAARANGWACAEQEFADRAADLRQLRKRPGGSVLRSPRVSQARELLEDLNQGRLYYRHVLASQAIHATAIGLSSRLRPAAEPRGAIQIPLASTPDE